MYSKIEQAFIRTEKYKFFVYWVLSSIETGILYVAKGGWLPIGIIACLGLTFLYVHALRMHSEAKRREYIRNEFSEAKSLLERISAESRERMNRQFADLSDKSFAINMNHIRTLIQMLDTEAPVKFDRKLGLEVVEDPNSGLKINNTYEPLILLKSEMFSDGKLKYYVEYDEQSKMSKSVNYDESGDALTELRYYPNEQVKERIEWDRSNGKADKTVTRYDENGNIKQ